MRLAHGQVVSKGGAEGIQCLSRVGEGMGVGIKVEDGASRAKHAVALRLLEQLEWLTPATLQDLRQRFQAPAEHLRLEVKGELRFAGVSFRYGNSGPMLLDELDLLIPAGQLVGIVGLSGSGKSTLVQLIDRLYLPRDGHIYLDGYAIDKLQLAGLRRRIGYVPQDSLLFEGTVLDNIRLNNPDADMEAVTAAAKVAAAHEFIMDLANGYATRLGERGSGLSGGQRQRICLARTVLQDPSLLILDEATSALDADTEQQVCRNLAKRFAGSTVLFITHRLTTLTGTDRILYMEKGQIIEDGTHAELLSLKGSYAALWHQQMGTKN
jgi:ATP-binding cassette subfamily B protein